MSVETHGRYAAWLACGIAATGDAAPSTQKKEPVANKKHLELGCGVPVVETKLAFEVARNA